MYNSKYTEYQKKPSHKMHVIASVTLLSNYYILGKKKGEIAENLELKN